jgi:hypothetical protein
MAVKDIFTGFKFTERVDGGSKSVLVGVDESPVY